MKSVDEAIAELPEDRQETIGARADELIAEGKQRYVYIVQYIGTGIIRGCFWTYENAQKSTDDSNRFWILKCEVL